MSELNAETKSALDAAMGLDAQTEEPAAAPTEDPVSSEPQASQAAEPAAEPAPEPQPEADGGRPAVSADLPELLRFKRQAEKKAREVEERAREEVAALKAKLEELEAKAAAPLQDPVEYFRSQGMSPLEVAKTLAAAELPPDKADPQARLRYEAMKAKKEQMGEVEKLRSELNEFKQAEEQRREADENKRIIAELRDQDATMLQSQSDSTNLVSSLYRSNPDYVLGQMLEIRRQYATQYPEDPIPTAEQAAELLESQLAPIASALQPQTPQSPQVSTTPEPKTDGPKPVLSSETLAGRTGKDKLPDDEEELVQYLAEQLKTGAFME